MNIRNMRIENRERVADIIRAHDEFDGDCAQRYFADYFADPKRQESESELVCVAEDNKGLVTGVSGFTPDKYHTPGVYWLNWTYIDEAFRRQGIASTLLAHVTEKAREAGGRKLYIDTGGKEEYAAAVAFYHKTGFESLGCLKDYYGPGDDLLILGKSI